MEVENIEDVNVKEVVEHFCKDNENNLIKIYNMNEDSIKVVSGTLKVVSINVGKDIKILVINIIKKEINIGNRIYKVLVVKNIKDLDESKVIKIKVIVNNKVVVIITIVVTENENFGKVIMEQVDFVNKKETNIDLGILENNETTDSKDVEDFDDKDYFL